MGGITGITGITIIGIIAGRVWRSTSEALKKTPMPVVGLGMGVRFFNCG
jgi:hypothetical protein